MKFWSVSATAALVGSALAINTQMPQKITRWVQREAFAERARCGKGIGSCPFGECCSDTGECSTADTYCQGPSCQIEYSGGYCDANMMPGGESTVNKKKVPRPEDGIALGKVITKCVEKNVVALTYDDGPFTYTQQLLDVLEKYHVKATLFVSGNSLGKGPIDDDAYPWKKLLQRAYKHGHQLGSHSWSHQNMDKSSEAIREDQIVYNEMAFRNIFGFFPRYFRPPYGSCGSASGCIKQLTSLGYHIVNWDIDTKDFDNNDPALIQNSKDRYDEGLKRGGSIVLAHEIDLQTVANLTTHMIEEAQARGLKFRTVAECLGEPNEADWYFDARQTTCNDGDHYDDPTIPDDKNCGGRPQPPLFTSLDGTCGWRSNFHQTCKGSAYGDCCSYNGFCGKSGGYCNGGCLDDFGYCNRLDKGEKDWVSENGLCGAKWQQTCQGSEYGNCCSQWNFCGNTSEYCATGCQSGHGSGCYAKKVSIF